MAASVNAVSTLFLQYIREKGRKVTVKEFTFTKMQVFA